MSIVPDFMNPAEFIAQQDHVLREQARLERAAAWAYSARCGAGVLLSSNRIDPESIHKQEPEREMPPMPQHDAPSA